MRRTRTQEFFARLIAKDWLGGVAPGRGKIPRLVARGDETLPRECLGQIPRGETRGRRGAPLD
jgi:hypothetical protein